MAILSRLFALLLLCTALPASGQEAIVESGTGLFTLLRLFCAPTNATGFITTTLPKSETNPEKSFPGRFWMTETCAVWQVELASATGPTPAQKKVLRDRKIDQVRYIMPMTGDIAYVVYPHAKAFLQVQMKDPQQFPPPNARFSTSEKLPEKFPIKELSPAMHNGNSCRRYELRLGEGRMIVWLSKNHRDFPIKIEGEKPGSAGALYSFMNVDFEITDRTLFEVPKGYTRFDSEQELKKRQDDLLKK